MHLCVFIMRNSSSSQSRRKLCFTCTRAETCLLGFPPAMGSRTTNSFPLVLFLYYLKLDCSSNSPRWSIALVVSPQVSLMVDQVTAWSLTENITAAILSANTGDSLAWAWHVHTQTTYTHVHQYEAIQRSVSLGKSTRNIQQHMSWAVHAM